MLHAPPDPTADQLGPAPTSNPAKPNEPGKNILPHWRGVPWGNLMASVQTIVFHETTGWPSYQSTDNFVKKYLCLTDENKWIPPKLGPPPVPGHWITNKGGRGIGPHYYIDGCGTVFALIGDHDLATQPRITYHTETINFTAIGIENGDLGDRDPTEADLRPADNANGPYWFRLNNGPDDMLGFKVFALLHPHNAPDLVLIWFATQATGVAIPNYAGSGDTDNISTRYPRWYNMLFTERNYRSLALLSRLLAEQYGLPRNFLVLPYSKVDSDGANASILRKLILADERRDMLCRKLGLTTADVQNNTARFTGASIRTLWLRYFGVMPAHTVPGSQPPVNVGPAPELPCYRGFHSHNLVGDHACPGPLFDWHRLAREVWDWWWYPFDVAQGPALFPPRRAYMRARGDTQLREYFYDSEGSDTEHAALVVAALDQNRGVNHFALPASTPVYAMANGVLVAARLTHPADAARPAFTLVRHEVFHQANAGNIDYDTPPSVVWTLTTYLNCDSINYAQFSTDNPDWLNRLLMRLKECELAVAYRGNHPGTSPTAPANDKLYQRAWDHQPTGEGQRLTTGQEIQNDATEYRRIVTQLQANNYVLFPLEATIDTTPVRVILGDFLGTCGTLPNTSAGIQVQIFSKDALPTVDTNQDTLVWATEPWWTAASAAVRLDGSPTASLPADGKVWQYKIVSADSSIQEFLEWINDVTWTSEWPKFGVLEANGAATPRPVRPLTRLVT